MSVILYSSWSHSSCSGIIGSLRWLSPEELAVVNKKCNREGGGGVGSEKSDIWSLGCILLELATSSFMEVLYYR